MAFKQEKFREIVFQILYSFDIAQAKEEDMLELIMKELEVTKKTVKTAVDRVHLIQEKQNEIDAIIAKISVSYNFERIQTIERNVLRLGAYELLFDDEIPPKVAIAEAIRLTRKFSTPESASFVNAILDSLYKSKTGDHIDHTEIEKSAEALSKSESIANQAAKETKNKQDL